jgi:hypothetical protein
MYRNQNDPTHELRGLTKDYEEEEHADDAFNRRILEVSREEAIQSRRDRHDKLMRELRRRMDLSDRDYKLIYLSQKTPDNVQIQIILCIMIQMPCLKYHLLLLQHNLYKTS